MSETAYNDKFPLTSAGKHRYKETEEGQQVMCEIMERLYSRTQLIAVSDNANVLKLRLRVRLIGTEKR